MKPRIFLLGLIGLLFAGCTFPYFNIYYNAKKSYNEAQKIDLKEDGKPASSAITAYNKAITKCSRIMTDFPKSKWADDALFLLAKSLFFRANSYMQAEDKFRDLISFYPDSPYHDDARIFIARCEYEIGHKPQAYTLLQQFLVDSKNDRKDPEVMDLLASYYLRDKDFGSANYYLGQIIKEYPKSKQFDNAYFMLGKSLYDNKDYARSDSVFKALLDSRISRRTKLDGRYYLSLNRLMLGDPNGAFKLARKLLKDEYQAPNLARYEIVRARALIGLGKTDAALEALNAVIKNNARSLSSAEAYYWIGEMYFTDLLDNAKAKENFNKVETEAPKSPLVPLAKARSAVVDQIIQFRDPRPGLAASEMVDHQLKLAETYLDVLDMPDSAIALYDRVAEQKQYYVFRSDSLGTEIDTIINTPDTVYTHAIDSLSALRDSVRTARDEALAAIDSTAILRGQTLRHELDILQKQLQVTLESAGKVDPPKAEPPDSTFQSLPQPTVEELELQIAGMQRELDSLSTIPPDPNVHIADSLGNRITFLSAQIQGQEDARRNREGLASMQEERTGLLATIDAYEQTYIPFSRFIKLRVLKIDLGDSLRAREVMNQLETDSPDSRYTFAARQVMNGEPPQLATPAESRAEARYEVAERLVETNPAAAASEFEALSHESLPIADRALLALGWVRFFALGDSLTSKACFDTLLARSPESDTATFIHTFYEDGHFKHFERLPYLIELEQQKAREEEERKAAAEKEAGDDSTGDKPGADKAEDPGKSVFPRDVNDRTPDHTNPGPGLMEPPSAPQPQPDGGTPPQDPPPPDPKE